MWVSGKHIYLHASPFIRATEMLKVHCWVPLHMAAWAQWAVGAQRTASGAAKLLLSRGGEAQGQTPFRERNVLLEVLTFQSLLCTGLLQDTSSSLMQIFWFRDLLVVITHSNSNWCFTFQIDGNMQEKMVVLPPLCCKTNSDKLLAGRSTVPYFMPFSGWYDCAWVTGLWDSSSKNRAVSHWTMQMIRHQVDRHHITLSVKFKFHCPSILRHGGN